MTKYKLKPSLYCCAIFQIVVANHCPPGKVRLNVLFILGYLYFFMHFYLIHHHHPMTQWASKISEIFVVYPCTNWIISDQDNEIYWDQLVFHMLFRFYHWFICQFSMVKSNLIKTELLLNHYVDNFSFLFVVHFFSN